MRQQAKIPVEPRLKPKQLRTLLKDPVKSAEAVNLVYVSDDKPGIERRRKGNSFIYFMGNKKVTDEEHLQRIKRLAIPPAWENVWICSLAHGHLQATGIDALRRKQYKYHALWNVIRNQTKFFKMSEFGRSLPQIRKKLDRDLARKGLPKEKVLALVVKLMELTNIRIGNNAYEKLYGSFGLTTLKDKHVKFNGNKIEFSFRGKKGIHRNLTIRSKRFAKLVKQCRDIPGQDLFQYMDENGQHHSISSGDVNAYIKEISGKDYTAKDFRTWSGTVQAITALKELGRAETVTAVQKNIVSALDTVSASLGNTRAVCKKYYVHPVVIELYQSQNLLPFLEKEPKQENGSSGLLPEERILLDIAKAADNDFLKKNLK